MTVDLDVEIQQPKLIMSLAYSLIQLERMSPVPVSRPAITATTISISVTNQIKPTLSYLCHKPSIQSAGQVNRLYMCVCMDACRQCKSKFE